MSNDLKKILKIVIIAIFFLFIIIFGFYRSKDLIFGVKIRNVNIINGSTTTADTLNITGNARNAIKISINGREISVNNQGDFDETIALLSGYNIINIKAEDKFGASDEKNYQLIKN